MEFKFEVGKPACPIACKYCHVTELDANRTAAWSKGLIGVNKACTFANVPPWITDDSRTQEKFYKFPWHLLKGDYAGWTAVTDGFMPSLRPYFWDWIEQVCSVAKLITVVTKWSISKEFMKELSQIPNLFLVITITGAESVEKIRTSTHLKSLALAKEYNVKCLPICHPYISGVSDLSFLPKVKSLGYEEICIKGLRYNPGTMGAWMPANSKLLYENNGIEEILPEDGWRQRVQDAGLSLLSPKQWYARESVSYNPKLNLAEATKAVEELLLLANIASSSSHDEVKQSAIKRRLKAVIQKD